MTAPDERAAANQPARVVRVVPSHAPPSSWTVRIECGQCARVHTASVDHPQTLLKAPYRCTDNRLARRPDQALIDPAGALTGLGAQ